MTTEVTRDHIVAAAGRIEGHVRRTPIMDLGDIHGAGYTLSLKLENLQRTGSFKTRGAFSLLTTAGIPEAGVVAASGGNFGLAVACAARDLGYRATIFVPETSPQEKVGRIAAYGVDLRSVPGFYPEALEAATTWAADTGAFQAHAYDQAEVVAGQGTCAREIFEDSPNVDTVLVPVGGGGLIAGIASWTQDDARVVAIEPASCPTLFEARRAGKPVEVEVGGIAASSLGASTLGEHAWHANQWIDESVLVTDAQIVEAQGWLWETCRLVVEPAAATTIAALARGVAYFPERGERIMAVISGANTTPGSVV